MDSQPSLFHGPREPPLENITIGQLIDRQEKDHRDRTHIISVWQDVRLSFSQFSKRSNIVAKALLGIGIQHGDCVGIFAGNCYQYLEVFVAAGRIGCPSVSFNLTYTPTEVLRAAQLTSCKVIFIARHIGTRDLSEHIQALLTLPQLKCLVVIDGRWQANDRVDVRTYDGFSKIGSLSPSSYDPALQKAQSRVKPSDVLNIQFTSGTTGAPKAAMLTHHNLLNNASLIAHCMHIMASDISINSAPLFHCLGLVAGFLLPLSVGATLVLPSVTFDAASTIDAVLNTGATILHSVPTMFIAYLSILRARSMKLSTLRAGICAGSPVPPALATQISDVMGMNHLTNAMGMTELSPCAFLPDPHDDIPHRILSVGKPMPHASAKIIDPTTSAILPVGHKGELCVAGYTLQKGYWNNQAKTDEVMRRDEHGVLWMHTGDECYFAADGYCYITGRIKDIIIRGGENVYPGEIEARLMAHPSVAEASVVGVADEKYGEVVGAFWRVAATGSGSGSGSDAGSQKQDSSGGGRPSNEEIKTWVSATLGRQKVPRYIFWIGDEGVGQDYPKTGSGKHQKFELRRIAERIVRSEREREKRMERDAKMGEKENVMGAGVRARL